MYFSICVPQPVDHSSSRMSYYVEGTNDMSGLCASTRPSNKKVGCGYACGNSLQNLEHPEVVLAIGPSKCREGSNRAK